MQPKTFSYHDITLVKLRALGHGQAAKVHKVYDVHSPSHPLALKIYHPTDTGTGCLQRFLTEGVAARAKLGPNPGYVDLAYTPYPEKRMTLFELAKGEVLKRSLIKYRSSLSRFFLSVVIAHKMWPHISDAAERGIAHDDMKPDNIAIDGSKGIDPKLILGIEAPIITLPTTATLFDIDLMKRVGYDQDDNVVGTPLYMSPEKCVGEAGPNSEKYTFGTS